MKSSELKKGEKYFAEFDYGQHQVEVLDTALFTDREVSKTVEGKEFADPPTPFDPNTGKPNPKVEKTTRRTVYETVREPGFKPRSSSFYRGGAKAGVPCRVKSAHRVDNPKFADDEGTERLVRPQDIKYAWATHVRNLRHIAEAEAKAKRERASFNERLELLKKKLPSADAAYASYANYAKSTTRITVNLAELEKLLANLDEEVPSPYAN